MNSNPASDLPLRFAELQADYGSYHFPELALQHIWRDGLLDCTRLATADGRPVEVLHPGTWNRLGGPDFLGAVLMIGGSKHVGDVEVHIHAADWQAHGHAADPAYATVILHLVLFPEPVGAVTRGYAGNAIPIAALLDLIPEDLESYAAAFALETLGGQSRARDPAALRALAREDQEAVLRVSALRRWQRKVADSRVRIARLGWDDACHTAALEILGYSQNRLAMHRLAGEWPLERWRSEPPRVADLLASQAGRWSRQGCRPANSPGLRLRQYSQWLSSAPHWPTWLREADFIARTLVEGDPWVLGRRGQELRRWLRDGLCVGAIPARRCDTLICDGFLPLLAALDRSDLEFPWLAWPAGDIPQSVESILGQVVTKPRPTRRVANGWVQGIWEGCLAAAALPAGFLGGS